MKKLLPVPPLMKPSGELPEDPRNVWCKIYGFTDFADLFTSRQLVALTTFSDLLVEVQEQIRTDALMVDLQDDSTPLRDGGTYATAYAEAVSAILCFYN